MVVHKDAIEYAQSDLNLRCHAECLRGDVSASFRRSITKVMARSVIYLYTMRSPSVH